VSPKTLGVPEAGGDHRLDAVDDPRQQAGDALSGSNQAGGPVRNDDGGSANDVGGGIGVGALLHRNVPGAAHNGGKGLAGGHIVNEIEPESFAFDLFGGAKVATDKDGNLPWLVDSASKSITPC
jgi:hypothetical protein